MKFSIQSMGGSNMISYKEELQHIIDYDTHYNIRRQHEFYISDELKDVEINSLEELHEMFSSFKGFSYPNCSIGIDLENKVIKIFDTWVQ